MENTHHPEYLTRRMIWKLIGGQVVLYLSFSFFGIQERLTMMSWSNKKKTSGFYQLIDKVK
jgi:hypothetical protein